jgi:hypothetical protein
MISDRLPRLTLLLLALFASSLARAQETLPRAPASGGLALSGGLPELGFLAPPAEAWLAEHPPAMPLRYGEVLPAQVDLLSAAAIGLAADGTRILQVEIHSPRAKSLGLEFSRFSLPEGALLFLHDGRGGPVHGAFGAHNQQADLTLALAPYPGERLVLELNLPADLSERTELELGSVVHDYRGVYGLEVDEGSAEGSCLIDINCAQGDPWRKQQRSVVRTLSNGALCSGVLVNNTAGNLVPYVLTAHHCGQGTNTVFLFNYETSGCGSGFAPENQSLSGCAVLATDAPNDERLLRINSNVPSNFKPFYAGWSREGNNAWYAVSIGHPAGGPKKISVDANGTQKQPNRWQVGWSDGMLLGGSSGGPLFDNFGRVRGNACCVNGFDCTQLAWFGRLDQFWLQQSIGTWLDPLGSGILTINGFDTQDPQNLLGNGGVGPAPGSGPSGPPVITSVSPGSLPAVSPEAPAILTLTGTGFGGTTTVTVDGQALLDFPPQFTVLSETQMTVQIFPQQKLGPIDIEVIDAQGSDIASVLLVPNSTPTLDLSLSDPSFLIQFVGLEMRVGSGLGDLAFFLASTSNLPTLLPGLANFSIGNGGSVLFLLGSAPVDGTKGYASLSQPLSGNLPTGLKVYCQAAVFELALGTFPLTVTNVQSGTILF